MSKKEKRIFWAIVLIVALALSALAFAKTRKPHGKVMLESPIKLPPVPKGGAGQAKQKAPAERIEVVRVTIRPTGFDPNEIEYPSNPFLLAVDNQSGMENLALELYQEDGEGKTRAKIRDLGLSLKSLSKREITVLKPGRYVLREVKHPDWVCHVTISQK